LQQEEMKFAYADPPYIGQAHRYPEKSEVDHRELVGRLLHEYPDGWALSCSSVSLKQVLDLCPSDVRIAAWVKPFAVYKVNVNPAFAWEPVVFYGGRPRGRDKPTIPDWVSTPIALRQGLVGAKPPAFVWWLFELLGMESDDELDDLFPGTGIVTDTLREWRKQYKMAF
jgi:hypothetical protein